MTTTAIPAEILPHPSRNDARIVYMDHTARAAEDAGEEPVIDYIGTDDSEDRYGSVISSAGWDTEPYMRSGAGVFLWAHQYNVPSIGKTIKLIKKKGSLQFRVRYAIDEFDFAATIYKLAKGGYLPGVSVGFIPKAAEEYESKTVPGFFAENKRYTSQELLELSAVPVPACRNALKMALQDHVVSENEIALGGLGDFILRDTPIFVTRFRGAETKPKVAAEPPALLAAREMREWVWVDQSSETVSESDKAAEVATMESLAKSAIASVDSGVEGWKSAKHRELRSICKNAVYEGMWRYDDIRRLMKDWYDQEPGAQPGETITLAMEELRKTEKRTNQTAALRSGLTPRVMGSLVSMVSVVPEGEMRQKAFERALEAELKGTKRANAEKASDPEVRDVVDSLQAIIDEAQAALDELDAEVVADGAGRFELRKGAKLSKKNKDKLKEVLKLLNDLDGLIAEEEDEEDAGETTTSTLVGGTSGSQNAGPQVKVLDFKAEDKAQFISALRDSIGSQGGATPDVQAPQATAGSGTEGSAEPTEPPKQNSYSDYVDLIMGRKK
jgi:hypothetical protein